MKRVIPHLSLGQKITAKVVETVGQRELIVNFHGDLLRVKNQAGRALHPGSEVELEVQQLQPLRFRLAAQGHSARFDRHA